MLVFLVACMTYPEEDNLPPLAAILMPDPNATYTTGVPIECAAQVVDDDLPGVIAEWGIGIDYYIADLNALGQTGMTVNLSDAKVHTIRFHALDADSALITREVEITVKHADRDGDDTPDVDDCAPDDPNYSIVQPWYQDADRDGYGSTRLFSEACLPETGQVLDHTDCNDADETIHPGSTEVCDNVDNNCDRFVDETCY